MNILVHVQLLCAQVRKELGFSWREESSSKQSKANVAPTTTVWPLFQRESCMHHMARSGGLGVGSCANRRPTNDFTIPLNTNKVLLYLHAAVWTEFQCQTLLHHNLIPRLGVRVGWAPGIENGTNLMSTPHSCATSVHNISLPCTM